MSRISVVSRDLYFQRSSDVSGRSVVVFLSLETIFSNIMDAMAKNFSYPVVACVSRKGR